MYITTFLTLLLSFLAITFATQQQKPLHHHNHNSATMSKSLNVFKQPLALHSTQPMTGFMRNGYCEVPASDYGNHAIAAEVTEEFLDFSAKSGNDLRPIPGMKGGCRWCLCVSRWVRTLCIGVGLNTRLIFWYRWREAFDAYKTHPQGSQIVPKIFLNATNEKALNKVSLEELKQFAADKQE
jgi:uncharacterized protein (DUF2237 family)